MLAVASANAELSALLSQNEAAQNYREEILRKELEYNILEDGLNRAEWNMTEQETKIYEQLSNIKDHSLISDPGTYSDDEEEYAASLSSTASSQESVSALRQQWLSKIGDRDLLIEQIHELRMDRERYVEEESIRHRYGLILDEEAQQVLDTFDTRHASLKLDLMQVEADLARLEEGLPRDADVLYASSQFDVDVESRDQETVESSLDMDATENLDLPAKDSLLLWGEEKDPVFLNMDTDPKQASISTVSYINQWLLHRLRRSAMEVLRYKITEELQPLEIDPSQFTRMVLESWFKDEMVRIFRQARDHAGKSISVDSKLHENENEWRATRSDPIIFKINHVSHEGATLSQGAEFQRNASLKVFHGSDFRNRSHHTPKSCF